MTAVVKHMGSRIVIRDDSDDSVNLLVLSPVEADVLVRKLRLAIKEQREVSAYERYLQSTRQRP